MAYENVGRQANGELTQFFRRFTNFTIAVPLMFVMIFLWLNGSAIWGVYWETNTALAYIIMFAFVIAVTQKNSLMWLTKLKVTEGLKNFWVGFLVMFAGLIGLSYAIGGIGVNSISNSAVYPQIALTALFVAPVEETIFRGVLKEYFKGWKLWIVPMGIIVTSALFSITHYAVYGGNPLSLWWAFLMGGVFYLMTMFKPSKTNGPLGVPGSIGAHTCYNLFILGILSGGILTGGIV